jgi:S1-C subfamily serine protease
MKFRTVCLCALLLAICNTAHAADWTAIAKKANESIVYIESASGSCTGFVINSDAKGGKDYIQTAAHCVGADIFADSAVARVIWKDTKHDLAILEVEDTGRPALRLAKSNPQIGEEVASYGYGMALARPMFRTAHVSDDASELPEIEGGPFVMIDAAYVGGQSGGPCINAAGEVVSIVQRASGLVGVGVGAERLASRAGRYYEKAVKP